ncbi:cytidine deaminase [Aestuariibacter salexigens]|uniref:cytidine deaminase n=1 Tax=Aestuariibacter salexigens TaxID=226010 RepID=UPI0003FF1F9A|nr:cytidine deaminase [Aestuariibacter salexigens]
MTTSSQSVRDALLDRAVQAQLHAYAPYSGFHVGAAILADNGEISAGCNVENVAYPLGQCAEATAIGNMVTGGGNSIKHIVIASPNDDFCYPCGGCRQKIKEFAGPDTVVELLNQKGKTRTVSVEELLPFAFTL